MKPAYEPLADHKGRRAPKNDKHRRALKLIAGTCEFRGDTRVVFIGRYVAVAKIGPDDLNLTVWITDELIEIYTDRLKHELGTAMFTEWMENPKP